MNPGLCFGRFLITNSISIDIISLFRFSIFHNSIVVGDSQSKQQGSGVNFRLMGSCRGSACWHGHGGWKIPSWAARTGQWRPVLGVRLEPWVCWNTTYNVWTCVKTQLVPSSSAILKHMCNILSSKKQKTYWQWCFCILRDHL